MKQFMLVLICFLSFSSFAQVSINATGIPPHSSAMLDVASSSKGLLIPRMTTALRNGIIAPAKGLMVMDTTQNTLWYFTGTIWSEMSSINASLWNSSGNNIFNTNTGNVGIGTTTPNTNALLHVDAGPGLKGFLVTGAVNTGSGSVVPDLGAGSRMLFYPTRAAFRAGTVTGTLWDNANVGTHSVATGYDTKASALASTAMGKSTIAEGFYSTAMGEFTKASGYASTAMGQLTTASAAGSMATGYGSTASANYSTAMGASSTASGNASTAMGFDTNAGGDNSIATGYYTIARGFASTVAGMYNDPLLASNQISSTNTTPLFIVGNGSSSSIRSNALVVLKSGDVEIAGILKPGNLEIGGGTTISKQLMGEATAGSNAGSGFKTYTLVFPSAFSGTPKIIATAKNDPAFSNVNDTFVVSVRSISATQAILNIQRVDNNTGWSQSLKIEWMAWE